MQQHPSMLTHPVALSHCHIHGHASSCPVDRVLGRVPPARIVRWGTNTHAYCARRTLPPRLQGHGELRQWGRLAPAAITLSRLRCLPAIVVHLDNARIRLGPCDTTVAWARGGGHEPRSETEERSSPARRVTARPLPPCPPRPKRHTRTSRWRTSATPAAVPRRLVAHAHIRNPMPARRPPPRPAAPALAHARPAVAPSRHANGARHAALPPPLPVQHLACSRAVASQPRRRSQLQRRPCQHSTCRCSALDQVSGSVAWGMG